MRVLHRLDIQSAATQADFSAGGPASSGFAAIELTRISPVATGGPGQRLRGARSQALGLRGGALGLGARRLRIALSLLGKELV